MADEGVCSGVDRAYGLHVWASAPSGQFLSWYHHHFILFFSPSHSSSLTILSSLMLIHLCSHTSIRHIVVFTDAIEVVLNHFTISPGAFMANSDRLKINISCAGGHASSPQGGGR